MIKKSLMIYFVLCLIFISFVVALDIPKPPATPGSENSSVSSSSTNRTNNLSNSTIPVANLVNTNQGINNLTGEETTKKDPMNYLLFILVFLIILLVAYYFYREFLQ